MGFRVWGLGLRVFGLGFRFWGLGYQHISPLSKIMGILLRVYKAYTGIT